MATNLHFPTNIDVSEFISKEAHDLKSPFNRALGFIKLVMKGMDGPISDQARDDLSTSYKNNQYAFILMGGLVEMARLSRGERHAELGACQVDSLLQQIIDHWKRQSYKEQPVAITLSAPAVVLQIDEMLFRQCVSNWISYVVEYAQQDAAVSISVEEEPEACVFNILGAGKKLQPPPVCDLTMYGYIASQTLDLQHGELRRAEENEQGVLIQFALPK